MFSLQYTIFPPSSFSKFLLRHLLNLLILVATDNNPLAVLQMRVGWTDEVRSRGVQSGAHAQEDDGSCSQPSQKVNRVVLDQLRLFHGCQNPPHDLRLDLCDFPLKM